VSFDSSRKKQEQAAPAKGSSANNFHILEESVIIEE